jgi:hypothetical protein
LLVELAMLVNKALIKENGCRCNWEKLPGKMEQEIICPVRGFLFVAKEASCSLAP